MHEPPLCVRRYDAPGRYLVRSERPTCPDWYLVELDDKSFPHGRCCCIDFDIRIEAPIRRGEEPPRATCKHLRKVRAELEHVAELCAELSIPPNPNMIPQLCD